MQDRLVGLIAGGGRLPVLSAQGIRAAGARVCAVGLRDHYDADLPGLCDQFTVAGVFRIGRWIRVLRRAGVRRAVLVGRVGKTRMHDPLRLLRQVPDRRAAVLWYRRLRHDRRNAAVLGALADELAAAGITLIDSTTYVTDHLAGEGPMTPTPPGPRVQADLAYGWPRLRRVVALDVGQAIAVGNGRVIAVESVEGTDAMIDRAGRLDGAGWVLLKAPADDHDMRFDVPAIGPDTIDRLARARAGAAALAAGRVIMIDKPQVIERARGAGIPIVGVRGGEAGRRVGT